jgi:hypothetical protein
MLADRVAFYHAAMFSPVLSTWCAAIDAGHMATWPDLTSAQVRRHFPVSIPMHLGHMDQTRANVQSTKPSTTPANTNTDTNIDTRPNLETTHTHAIFADLHMVTGKVQSDQTGRFATTSLQGNAYLMIVYDYDSNSIHAEPLKSRSGPCILTG